MNEWMNSIMVRTKEGLLSCVAAAKNNGLLNN